jgi:adenylate cyclase
MRIRYSFKGEERGFLSPLDAIVVGRAKENVTVDLQLTADATVSRPHARISFENGQYWIEDLGSRLGTFVDAVDIKGRGKVQLNPTSGIRIGATTLFVEMPEKSQEATQLVANAKISPILQPKEPATLAQIVIDETESAPDDLAVAQPSIGAAVPLVPAEPVTSRHQRVLYELLLNFGTAAPLDKLLQLAVERLLSAIPAARRGSLLLKEPGSDGLLLKAHSPAGEPAVSLTLAEHAMSRGGGFIWHSGGDAGAVDAFVPGATPSMESFRIASGIYAPLVWRGETFGAVCVDNSDTSLEFGECDLEFVVAVGQHVALVISNYRLREDARRNAALVERLLTNFSPAVRRRLLQKARAGRLKLGGEKSEVTILSSDIRGFTTTTADMDPADVVDMLNGYFSAMVNAVFRHGGTVDKFIGDAILAVFGSPEPDAEQHLHAVHAAMAMQSAIAEVNEVRRARGQVVCEMGIGIHCGEVLHGFVGSEERMEFTVIGDAVNRAARYCDGARGGQVLISQEMYQRVWQSVRGVSVPIATKHEGEFRAFRVSEVRKRSAEPAAAEDAEPAPGRALGATTLIPGKSRPPSGSAQQSIGREEIDTDPAHR